MKLHDFKIMENREWFKCSRCRLQISKVTALRHGYASIKGLNHIQYDSDDCDYWKKRMDEEHPEVVAPSLKGGQK